jgi:dihydroorotate dehydrogenase electron transfer subunit
MKFTSKILSTKEHENDYHLMVIEKPFNFDALPGQFALIQVPGFKLRRPLSFFDITEKEITFFFKPNGLGLLKLKELGLGDHLVWFGPYGHELPHHNVSLFSHHERHPALHFLAKKMNIPIQSIDKINHQDNMIVATDLKMMLKNEKVSPKALLFCQETMGCGIGACMSCVIKTSNGEMKKICQDGPFIKKDEL